MTTKSERLASWPPLDRNQLLATYTLASQKTCHIPAGKGWKASENTMNAALSFIAELYDHHEHTYHRRVLYQWENGVPNSWFVKIFTGKRFEVFYIRDPRGIYNDEGRLEIMRRFEALCQNHHNEIWPPEPEETPEERLARDIVAEFKKKFIEGEAHLEKFLAEKLKGKLK